MIRRAAACILALALNPALLHAQESVLTVDAASADVYKGPSTVTPVIGHVSRGTVLPVSRNLGSWVKVPWSAAPDGVGYVHVTNGRLGPPNAGAAATSAATRASSAPEPVTKSIPLLGRTSVGEQVVPRGQLQGTPASRIVGIGGLVESANSAGATARAWRNNHLGIQFAFTRAAVTAADGAARMTSLRFEPGVVYALFDRVSDYVWIRPYVGSAASFRQQTSRADAVVTQAPVSDHSVGFRVFGGSELTFASIPRFALSADLGYRRFATPFPGFEERPLSLSIAGHWYVK